MLKTDDSVARGCLLLTEEALAAKSSIFLLPFIILERAGDHQAHFYTTSSSGPFTCHFQKGALGDPSKALIQEDEHNSDNA